MIRDHIEPIHRESIGEGSDQGRLGGDKGMGKGPDQTVCNFCDNNDLIIYYHVQLSQKFASFATLLKLHVITEYSWP